MLRIPLPALPPHTEVEYTLEVRASKRNGSASPDSTGVRALGPRPSEHDRRLALDEAIGSIVDPTFVRPPQGDFTPRESLD